MRTRIFAFLTALLMLAALLPASALAYTDSHRSYERSNPLLPAAADTAPFACDLAPTEAEPQYETDPAVLSAALRDAMEQRTSTITLYYRGDHELTDDELDTLFYNAFEETGVPTQGDYLRLSWRRYRITIDTHEDSGVYDHAITYTITYETSSAQEAELAAELERVISEFGFTESTTEYDKIRTIYDYICSSVTYDYEHLSDRSYRLKYTAYAALLHKTAVCEGYAELFYRMALRVGLHSRIITGRSNSDNHAWNIVQLGDLYYYIDTTWDAMGESRDHFLKGSSDFFNHTADARCSSAEFLRLHPIADAAYVPPEHNPFTDVSKGDYFFDPVLWALRSGITGGTASDRFSPNASCTRAQAVTLLWRAAGSPETVTVDPPFADVTEADYFHTAVLWAMEQGITSGIGDGLFGPERTCTRAEIVTFLYRAAHCLPCLKGGGPLAVEGSLLQSSRRDTILDESPFTDVSDTDYFYTPVLWASDSGITSGIGDGLFGPERTCSRAQIVTFLYRAYR